MSERVRISYAQNGEDVRAWRALRHIERGFYVEVGASHPFDHSLSAALSAEGWSGVLIEPEPAAAEALRAARPRDTVVAAAASAQPGVLRWHNDGDRGEGRVAEAGAGLAVPAVRVADVLADVAPSDVHFMSVDVEGHEREALLGVDLERWRPWILCVEATAPLTRTRTHAAWEPLVLDAGYRYVTFDGLNRWYVSSGHEELEEAVREPFGVLDIMLDGWRRAETVALERRLDEAVAEVDRLRQERHQDMKSLERLHLEHQAALERSRYELQAVEAERDAALEREHVLLTSKSWRLTKPLRAARLSAWLVLQQRRGSLGSTALPTVPREPDGPGDARRRRALLAKVEAAKRRHAR